LRFSSAAHTLTMKCDEMARDRLTVCKQELLKAFARLVSIRSNFLLNPAPMQSWEHEQYYGVVLYPVSYRQNLHHLPSLFATSSASIETETSSWKSRPAPLCKLTRRSGSSWNDSSVKASSGCCSRSCSSCRSKCR